jgi:hypothetical protein
MKRLALLLAALCITTYASAGLNPKFKFGVKAGLDYQANYFSSGIKNFDIHSNSGWFAGAMADLSWGKLGIHPEVLYSHNSFAIAGADGMLKTNRIDVPVLLNYNLLGILNINAGPRFCIMDHASGSSEGVKWQVSSPTVGYAVGVETTIWKISISARYNGAFKRTEVLGFTAGKNQPTNIQLGVGYYF